MSSKMLTFVTTEKAMPEKRKAEKRVADFDEIYDDFDAAVAETQSSRCSQCGVPFCQVNCPLHNNIPDWLMLTAEGRMQEAYELSSQTNNFPEICGRICPQDRLCEGSCVIEKGFESVTIGAVEKHITETAFAEGWVKPAAPRVERAESIGIIGAGPAGLAAAEMLRHRGYQVHIYDRYDRIGGLLMYGIPASITLAQGMLESGNGNSDLAVYANNHFGIKCHDWTGKEIYHDDDEEDECFRKYKSDLESFIDHSEFLVSKSRYADLFKLKEDDYKAWARGLKKAGYATSNKYADLLIGIIEENELFGVPIAFAVVNFPPSVEVMRTVPAPRSPIIEIPLLEYEIAVIKIGAVALSEYVAMSAPAEVIFHKVKQFNSLRSAGTCSTTTPSTLTGLLVAF